MRQDPKFLQQNPEAKMTAVAQARDMLCTVPKNVARNETTRAWLRRIGSLFRISEAEASRIYYRQKKRLDADQFENMKAALGQLQEGAARRGEMLDDLKTRLATLRHAHGIENPRSDRRESSPPGERGDGNMAGGRSEG